VRSGDRDSTLILNLFVLLMPFFSCDWIQPYSFSVAARRVACTVWPRIEKISLPLQLLRAWLYIGRCGEAGPARRGQAGAVRPSRAVEVAPKRLMY
jgi:hypothetical protein